MKIQNNYFTFNLPPIIREFSHIFYKTFGIFIEIIIFAYMNQNLKKIIFKKLYQDLSNVEIITHNESIWFIDRENKYWYIIYEKTGFMYWRLIFFREFFQLFCMESDEFEWVIAEWVEEVLNCKVVTPMVGFPL